MFSNSKDIEDLAESVQLIAMGYWTNLGYFVSNTALHDELNEVIKFKAIEQLINSFPIIQYLVFTQICNTWLTILILFSKIYHFLS